MEKLNLYRLGQEKSIEYTKFNYALSMIVQNRCLWSRFVYLYNLNTINKKEKKRIEKSMNIIEK